MEYQNNLDFAKNLDTEDPLKEFRDKFFIPVVSEKELVYFCGNSLGLQPKTVNEKIMQELYDWQYLGVNAHFNGKNPWVYYHHFLKNSLSRLAGSKPSEVVAMNSLTVNLHLMLTSFYRPSGSRTKIFVEPKPFPSDHYAIESHARLHGYEPADVIVELDNHEFNISNSDIIQKINELGDELALVIMGGVNYYTGQVFDMHQITQATHKAGAIAGFDLAHAIGNLNLSLHDWDVDFAVWCSYKYMNSGPGGVGGAFVHEKHGNNKNLKRLAGWWGYLQEERFKMLPGFIPMQGADGWQLSNAPVFPMAIQKASLDIFDEAGMDALRKKSEMLTGFLYFLLNDINSQYGNEYIKIITPKNPDERGCQISIIIKEGGRQIFDNITERGVAADWREPDVIRVAPVPLYNKFEEVFEFSTILKETIQKVCCRQTG